MKKKILILVTTSLCMSFCNKNNKNLMKAHLVSPIIKLMPAVIKQKSEVNENISYNNHLATKKYDNGINQNSIEGVQGSNVIKFGNYKKKTSISQNEKILFSRKRHNEKPKVKNYSLKDLKKGNCEDQKDKNFVVENLSVSDLCKISDDLYKFDSNEFLNKKIISHIDSSNDIYELSRYSLECTNFLYFINDKSKFYGEIDDKKDIIKLFYDKRNQVKCDAYINSDGSSVSLTFCGSLLHNFKDIKEDWFKVNFFSIKNDENLHIGYKNRYNLIENKIWQELYKHQGKNLLVNGHSMGAAESFIFLIDLIDKMKKQEIKFNKISFVLAAIPMSVSDAENFKKINNKAKNLGINLVSIVNNGDPIIKLNANSNNVPLGTQITLNSKNTKIKLKIKNHKINSYIDGLNLKDIYKIPLEQNKVAIKDLENNSYCVIM